MVDRKEVKIAGENSTEPPYKHGLGENVRRIIKLTIAAYRDTVGYQAEGGERSPQNLSRYSGQKAKIKAMVEMGKTDEEIQRALDEMD